MLRSLRSALAALVAAAAFSACEGDVPVSVQSPETITYADVLNVDLGSMTRTANGVYYKDIDPGTEDGLVAATGSTIGVRYAGFLNDGTLFDSKTSGTFVFQLGAGTVIQGWDQGIPGMKVGGRRQLVIPPALAYGNAGRGAIPGGAVLIFTVDLFSVTGGGALAR